MADNGSDRNEDGAETETEPPTPVAEVAVEANTLPKYLVTRHHNTDAIRLEDIEEENEEVGNGGDSDEECIDSIEFGDAFAEVESSRIRTELEDNSEINYRR